MLPTFNNHEARYNRLWFKHAKINDEEELERLEQEYDKGLDRIQNETRSQDLLVVLNANHNDTLPAEEDQTEPSELSTTDIEDISLDNTQDM
ncbi:hypothetical protein AKO1_007973 [Acrasis kona]|uniref:Uncharacterized protein n=1 Tax=Acrasis kona TaxID=1008807 RepID=A0AAW2YQC7_9EUKA